MGQVLPTIALEIYAMLAIASHQGDPDDGPTLFSQPRFVNAIVRATGDSCRAIKLLSQDLQSTIFGVETIHSFGRRSIALAPFGLYAHPSHGGDLVAAVKDIIGQLKTYSTLTFQWSVRFDHAPLAHELLKSGLPFSRPPTHVLSLDRDYERSFAKFSATTRNLVRRVKREGVVIRSTFHADDVRAYYEVHTKLASEKGNYSSLYPKAIFDELLKLHSDVVFIVAEVQGNIAGGGWFFRDGATLLYWHGAMDRRYSRQSPSYGIVDYAIQMAHEEGRKVLNFGGSIGLASLEHFKSKWGAEPRYCWCFSWHNPFWQKVQKIRRVCSLRRLHAR